MYLHFLVTTCILIIIVFCGHNYAQSNEERIVIEVFHTKNSLKQAQMVAKDIEYSTVHTIPHLKNKFVLKRNRLRRSIRSIRNKRRLMSNHPLVKNVITLTNLNRHKRYLFEMDFENNMYWSIGDTVMDTDKTSAAKVRKSKEPVHANLTFIDPDWPKQWYLNELSPQLHLLAVWGRNITGRGVVVAVLDDGLEWTHPDLKVNYDPKASFDFNNNKKDPSPRYDARKSNRHGTRCAGIIAMSANNSYCGVGIAYNAKIGGIKVLDGAIDDLIESLGLSHQHKHIDIYSMNWGPPDDGQTMEGPGPLAREAFEVGVSKGRGGKGNIYVWATGNGGNYGDDCNADGYTNSIYTVGVSSASFDKTIPWYAEHCAASMATVFGSGLMSDKQMVSSDIDAHCTGEFVGTSASAPIAAGIIALMLEANPALTWRDVQHAIAWTSNSLPLIRNPGWQRNAAHFHYHHYFGFGLLNADALTTLVNPKTWVSVQNKSVINVASANCSSRVMYFSRDINCYFPVNNKEINYLEHAQLKLSLWHNKRGSVSATLISPAGTKSQILKPRFNDYSNIGFNGWTFMSVHFWGESARGVWTLRLHEEKWNANSYGYIDKTDLILHGTAKTPPYRVGKRKL